MSSSIARILKCAGFEYIELGIESGDPDILRRSRKGIMNLLDEVRLECTAKLFRSFCDKLYSFDPMFCDTKTIV